MTRGNREIVRVTLRPEADRHRVGPPLAAKGPSQRSTPRSGQWRLHLPAGHERIVGIVNAGERRVIMHLGSVLGGQYVWNGERLIMERPNDERYKGLAWTWNDDELVLIDEPASHPAGPRYVGARLTWIDPNPLTVRPREHLGETENARLAVLVARDPKSGHVYQRGNEPMTWHEAKAYCENLGGHLATISSAEENEFLYQTFARDQACWLGATREERSRQWRWVTGEPMNYTNWFRDEPLYSAGDQGDELYVAFGNRVSMRGNISFHVDGYWQPIADAGQESRLAFVLPLCEWEPGAAPADIAERAGASPSESIAPTDVRFDLLRASPIDDAGFERLDTNDGAAWRFDVAEPHTIRLVSQRNSVSGNAIVTFRAEMRTEVLDGRAFLELVGRASADAAGNAAAAEKRSRGYHHVMQGSSDWKFVETPLLAPASPPTEAFELNLVVEGTGVVWLRNMELKVRPLNPPQGSPRPIRQ
jgi:hypothetical protein